jgi:hypothetical protein
MLFACQKSAASHEQTMTLSMSEQLPIVVESQLYATARRPARACVKSR